MATSLRLLRTFKINNLRFQILNVPGFGNCFYEMVRLGLYFYDKIFSEAEVRTKFFDKMREMWAANSIQFRNCFNGTVLHRFKNDLSAYISVMQRRREWATFFEVCMCSLAFSMEIVQYNVESDECVS